MNTRRWSGVLYTANCHGRFIEIMDILWWHVINKCPSKCTQFHCTSFSTSKRTSCTKMTQPGFWHFYLERNVHQNGHFSCQVISSWYVKCCSWPHLNTAHVLDLLHRSLAYVSSPLLGVRQNCRLRTNFHPVPEVSNHKKWLTQLKSNHDSYLEIDSTQLDSKSFMTDSTHDSFLISRKL
jgi:hypothetical protein